VQPSRNGALRLAVGLALAACLLVAGATARAQSAPIGTGKTVAYALSRSGSAGAVGGPCGTRLQCFKAAIGRASAGTQSIVENAALVLLNVAQPEQDVDLQLAGKQLLIAPDADPDGNGRPDLVDALDRVSLGGGTCYACALQAAALSFRAARPDSVKVIVLVSDRANTFSSTGFTSAGLSTGYPPASLRTLSGQFDSNTIIRAFAVGPSLSCSSDPSRIGSLKDAAAVTPGGTCTHVKSFDRLGAVLADALRNARPTSSHAFRSEYGRATRAR
jgi:hypothetical protein